MKLGGIVNTATRRQSSADAVGALGMLGKYTDGLRETALDAHCMRETWLSDSVAGAVRHCKGQ